MTPGFLLPRPGMNAGGSRCRLPEFVKAWTHLVATLHTQPGQK